ncbi:MAG: D-alanine--(R)-lactate ligase VanF [Ilumatobacteraceae bacterium]|nr:D-alanine--(R)-lactate ligase VanF [Ilumatobacteraceae bacterium]
MTKKPKIAILFGGCSEEHDVSVKSAMEVASSIDRDRYEPIFIGIGKSGVWSLCDTPAPGWQDAAGLRAVISPDRGAHGLMVVNDGECEMLRVDVVFPVLHGRLGEDGAIQGLLELSGIPYVGCHIQSSAICMDKSLAYTVVGTAGIPTPEFHVLSDAVPPTGLSYPVFVKPARSGSSFGVSKVERDDDMAAAIAAARQYDSKVLIEQAVVGTEVGCAVLGNGADLFVGEVDQIDLSHGLFRIHQEAEPEKGSENAVITVPANISADVRDRVRATARAIYTAIGCEGLARVDMFLQPDGRVVLNEVNTLPGFTSYSRYPRMMAAAGVSMSSVIDRCITLALER